MKDRIVRMIPHVVIIFIIYVTLVLISSVVFGYDDLWMALAIAVAILYGYKPIVVALGYGLPEWKDEIESR